MGCGCNKKKNKNENKVKFNSNIPPNSVKVSNNKMPSMAKRAFNFAKSATDYVRSGMDNVEEEVYHTRLSICNDCPFRKKSTCTKCGCFIEVKARWSVSTCPDNRWPQLIKNNKDGNN